MASHYATSVGLGDNTDQKACPVSETIRAFARPDGMAVLYRRSVRKERLEPAQKAAVKEEPDCALPVYQAHHVNKGTFMARDLSADIDRLTSQLADLRASLARQASASAEDASDYLVPRARQVARQFRHEFRHGGHDLTEVIRRNPGTTTGAVVGALVLTAAFAFLLSKAGSDRN